MVVVSKRGVFLAIIFLQLILLAVFLYVSLCVQSVPHAQETTRIRLPSSIFAGLFLGRAAPDVLSWEATVTASCGDGLNKTPLSGFDTADSVVTNSLGQTADGINSAATPETDSQLENTTRQRADGVFQPIDNQEAWLYSAYFDHISAENGKPLVRVFGVVKDVFLLDVFCHFCLGHKIITTSGVLTELPESQNKKSRPAYVDCHLPRHAQPLEVSITFKSTTTPTNRLRVQYPGANIRHFTVCYSVLHSNYNMASQLIQSIEMNRILGAEHFMVYNYSISPLVDRVLRRYMEEGLVTVLPWPIPNLRIWYFGQMTALNDCFYRNRNISKYVVVVDTDEMIVPRKHDTWLEILQNISAGAMIRARSEQMPLPTNSYNRPCCFIFRSSMFNTETGTLSKWNSLPAEFSFTAAEKRNVLKHELFALAQFWRSEKLFQFKVRSKYMACTAAVEVAGIHYVHKLTNAHTCLNIKDGLAVVHHYRKPKELTDTVLDASVLRFKDKLYSRLMKRIDNFHGILP